MRLLAAVILLCACLTPAAAEFNLDRAKIACKPDVLRLCTLAEKGAALFGDYAGVIACLRREQANLSPTCRKMLDGHVAR
jgi:hypothetical protein